MTVRPKALAAFYGVLGVAAFLGSGAWTIFAVGALERARIVYFCVVSALLICAAARLWKRTPAGWWLSWAAMIAVALSGILPYDGAPHAGDGARSGGHAFQVGVMMLASGFVFSTLSHADVYRACFGPRRLPHPVVVGTPLALILAGTGLMAFAPSGVMMAPVVIGGLVLSGHTKWMARPLVGAVRRGRDWDAG